MSSKLEYSDDAQKQLECLDKSIQVQILKKLEHLKENPELGVNLHYMLKHQRRLHIGKFRVLYSIFGNLILIVKVGHRKDVYLWR